MKNNKTRKISRLDFLRQTVRWAFLLSLGGVAGAALGRSKRKEAVWQIDPAKCTQCGKCATECVLRVSAVKCVHNFSICGYCNICFGYFEPGKRELDTGAESQLCPTGAISRKFVEDPYYEYTINEERCVGCGKCVKGCTSFGNGSLQLQIRHDRCKNCNECAIAKACPNNAFVRVPSDTPYLTKENNEK
ncbi:MAG: 4Fe-4S dicluster domain-containing protein [Candidatus Firestonebacteria bacterium]